MTMWDQQCIIGIGCTSHISTFRRITACGRNAINSSTYYGEALGSDGAIDRSTPQEWEMFDLEKDLYEMHNVYADPAYANVVVELKTELERFRDDLGDYE